MHRDLERLIQAYDAAVNADPNSAADRKAIFDQLFKEALARHRALSDETLRNVIRFAHRRWVKAEAKPSTLPPKA